jgi:hypothetical protein
LKKKGDVSFKNPPQMKLLQVVGLGGWIALHLKRTGAGRGAGRLLHWEGPNYHVRGLSTPWISGMTELFGS